MFYVVMGVVWVLILGWGGLGLEWVRFLCLFRYIANMDL